jgi:2-polyprenyl-3-methyl-5-hydroxy-6-metoxy-1,4-benzoquinol methylase
MTGGAARAALSLYDGLPLRERLFVRARLASAPLLALAGQVPDGTVADVGCGHGLLTALLAVDSPSRTVIGVDPDARKIAWARSGPGKLPNVRLSVGTIRDLSPELDGKLDAVVVADVLYLLPSNDWPQFLAQCRRLLRPSGVLLLKEAEANGSWKYWKCVLQEQVMVRVLGKTQSSGGLQFKPREFTWELLQAAGFRVVQTRDVSKGYATPHVLYSAAVAS